MDDPFEMIPINEDDVVMNCRFHLCYSAHEGIDFQDKWIKELIDKKFTDYTFNNNIRINNIKTISTDTIIFDVKLLNVTIAPQAIADDILDKLHDAVNPALHGRTEEMWRELKIFSIGDDKESKEMIEKYLRKLHEGE